MCTCSANPGSLSSHGLLYFLLHRSPRRAYIALDQGLRQRTPLTYGEVNVHKDKLFVRVQEAIDEFGYAEKLQLQQKLLCQYAFLGLCQVNPNNGQAFCEESACT